MAPRADDSGASVDVGGGSVPVPVATPPVVTLPPHYTTVPEVQGPPAPPAEVMGPPAAPSPQPSAPSAPVIVSGPAPVAVTLPPALVVPIELTPIGPPAPPAPVVTLPELPIVVTPDLLAGATPAQPAPTPQPVPVDLGPITSAIGELQRAIATISGQVNSLTADVLARPSAPDVTPQLNAIRGTVDAIPARIDQAIAQEDARIQSTIRGIRRDTDALALGVGNTQADVGALRRVLEGISANPNLVPIPPSAQAISDGIAAYFSLESNRAKLKGDRGLKGDKGDKGEKGDTGPSLPVDQIDGAINDYLRRNPPLAGRDGQPGKDGKNGVDGRTPTPAEVRGVVEEVLSGVRVFLSSPADFIWDVILKGIRERIGALFDAVTAET